WFNMSWVTYSNEAKMRLLGVNSATLQTFGAVSEETVREMASGAKVQAASDFAIGISGIAGPGGGTPNKPVGTVCFGLASVHGVQTWTAHFAGNRNEVREQAVDFALGKLLEILA
ncbi:MAG: CinA family protein, partial [Neisseria sp.]|nr:CinA family protein [Neisseria sp.]